MVVPEISCSELSECLAGPASGRPVLVDVRTPAEHQLVALPGSLLMPLQELDAMAEALEQLRGRRVVVYCHHGVRSLHGAAFLQSLGMEVASLAGGIDRYAQEINPSLPRY